LTTSAGIMDHDEARRKNVGGKVLGFFYWVLKMTRHLCLAYSGWVQTESLLPFCWRQKWRWEHVEKLQISHEIFHVCQLFKEWIELVQEIHHQKRQISMQSSIIWKIVILQPCIMCDIWYT
jgi:small subunit ribosomal protein S15Ae